jgi:hypothetical protein
LARAGSVRLDGNWLCWASWFYDAFCFLQTGSSRSGKLRSTKFTTALGQMNENHFISIRYAQFLGQSA